MLTKWYRKTICNARIWSEMKPFESSLSEWENFKLRPMKTCLGAIAALSIIAGLFVLVPVLVVDIPDMKTIRPGEMVVTGVRSVRIGGGSNNHAIGYIRGDGRKAVFSDVGELCRYIGFCDIRFTEILKSDSPPLIPVWYTDSGYAISRFGRNELQPPNFHKNVMRTMGRISFFFVPALLLLIYYGYEHWKRSNVPLLLFYALAVGPDAWYVDLWITLNAFSL